jgi:hypothetical protein
VYRRSEWRLLNSSDNDAVTNKSSTKFFKISVGCPAVGLSRNVWTADYFKRRFLAVVSTWLRPA